MSKVVKRPEELDLSEITNQPSFAKHPLKFVRDLDLSKLEKQPLEWQLDLWDQLSPEQCLLLRVRGFDPTKSPYADEAITVLEFCEEIGRDYEPGATFTVNDILQGLPEEEALNALSGAIFAKVRDADDCIAWDYAPHPYAPHMTFFVSKASILHYCCNGWFLPPIESYHCPLLVKQLGYDLNCADVEVLWGKCWLGRSESGHKEMGFEGTSAKDATHILFVTHWGGASSVTRGITEEFAEEQGVYYFEKRQSKRGREGRDYLALPIEQSPEEIRELMEQIERKRQLELVEDEAKFYSMQQMIEAINEKSDELTQKVDDINQDIMSMVIMCRRRLQLPYVRIPKLKMRECKFPEPDYKGADEAELLKLYNALKAFDHDCDTYLLRKNMAVTTWLKYAPQFAALHDKALELGVRLKVTGKRAYMTFPFQEKAINTVAYVFSEEGLMGALDDLQDWQERMARLKLLNAEKMAALGITVPKEDNKEDLPDDTDAEEEP